MITILQEKRGENECFVVSDNKRRIAECLYSSDNSEIISVSYFDEDFDDIILESVVRATLSKLDFAGKTNVIYKKDELGDFFIKLGFEYNDGLYRINTTEFFNKKHCNTD